MPSIEEFSEFTVDLVKKAGELLLDYRGKLNSVGYKSSRVDLVTDADLASQQYIVSEIKHCYPDHAVLAEEGIPEERASDYCWVIDPLDGTTNFVHGLPVFAVSVGLQIAGETQCGAIYNPATRDCYHAVKRGGACCNDASISVSGNKNLIDSILVTGFPYAHDAKFHKSFELFHDFHNRVQGMRRLGAAALDFCFVAQGVMDGFYEFNLKPWDICAGDLILREAGGKTSSWSGADLPFDGSTVLATNGKIHQEMREILGGESYSLFMQQG